MKSFWLTSNSGDLQRIEMTCRDYVTVNSFRLSGLRGHFLVGDSYDALNCSVILCKLQVLIHSALSLSIRGKVTSQTHQMPSDEKKKLGSVCGYKLHLCALVHVISSHSYSGHGTQCLITTCPLLSANLRCKSKHYHLG